MRKMRTIAEAFEHVKKSDPGTALTLYALRGMVKTGAIPSVKIGRKRLICLDDLNEYLSGTAEVPAHDQGRIRKVVG